MALSYVGNMTPIVNVMCCKPWKVFDIGHCGPMYTYCMEQCRGMVVRHAVFVVQWVWPDMHTRHCSWNQTATEPLSMCYGVYYVHMILILSSELYMPCTIIVGVVVVKDCCSILSHFISLYLYKWNLILEVLGSTWYTVS